MHHPGPPRFVAAGDTVELAPRDPDPTGTYAWRLTTTPDGSQASLGEEPVEHLRPDVPGTYVARLSAPDGEHDLTVRAFPGALGSESGGRSGASAGRSGESGPGRPGGISGGSGSARGDPTGDGGRPRVRLHPTIEDGTAVVRAEALPHPDSAETPADLDVEFLLDDRDAPAGDAATVEGATLRLPTVAVDERVRVHAVAVGEDGFSVPDAVAFERAAPGGDLAVSHLHDPPGWATDSVIYEIYVRTFPGQSGTDAGESVFDAIRERLDYIDSLGVDTLWLTPVLENDHADHGYNITDFFSIAEDLGTRADYERLIDAAHDRDIRVLFDLVCNHSARDHPHFRAAVADPDSPYREWYEWRGPTEPETYFEWEYIANFDFTHLPVRRHLLDAIDQWAPLVDGFRIDMAWAVPNNFWREVHDRVKSIDDAFLLLDETIPYIPEFQGGCFDTHFDSTTYAALRRVGNGAPATAILAAIDQRARVGFPPHAGFMLYAENHDETRYLVECGRPAAEAAAGALFTLPGSPMVYAGQEFGQLGKRDPLAWADADEDLRAWYRTLSETRREEPALASGADCRRLACAVRDGDPDRVVAFARVAEGTAVAVVLHFGEGTARVAVPAAKGTRDAVSGADVDGGDGTVTVDSAVVVPADLAAIGE
ncbi:MAG: alpha-amylase MalA [Haloarculaceae archaeon]